MSPIADMVYRVNQSWPKALVRIIPLTPSPRVTRIPVCVDKGE